LLNLDDAQKQEVIRFCKFFIPDAAVYIFGSRAKGTATPRSDLDIALESTNEIPYGKLMQLKDALNNSDLPFHIDVVNWQTIPPSFRAMNEKERILLSS